ncbi:MAG: hypothetical protein ACRYFX_07040 [Janthinobacterium lividum]
MCPLPSLPGVGLPYRSHLPALLLFAPPATSWFRLAWASVACLLLSFGATAGPGKPGWLPGLNTPVLHSPAQLVLEQPNGDLIVGGDFTDAGGHLAQLAGREPLALTATKPASPTASYPAANNSIRAVSTSVYRVVAAGCRLFLPAVRSSFASLTFG